jgi:hypothetical protein
LTIEQQKSIESGEPVRLTPPEVGVECAVVRADVYDRVKTLLYIDEPMTPEERLAAIHNAGARAGWNDPSLDVYEEYRRKP